MPNVQELYAVAARREARNPVIVIHGVLGSRLVDRETDQVVWGAFTSEAIDPETEAGALALALPLGAPLGGAALQGPAPQERVIVTGPVEAIPVDLGFATVDVQVYSDVLRTLGAGGYRDRLALSPDEPAYREDHFTCFSFFYDWRRDIVESAAALDRFIAQARQSIAKSAPAYIARRRAEGTPAALAEALAVEEWLERGYRFDIVAHSMGGLLARYYVRYGATDLPAAGLAPEITWAGSREIDRLLIVAAPNLGSALALERLTEGLQPAFFLPQFRPGITGTMPALYQLLPRDRHTPFVKASGHPVPHALYDVATWEANDWGLLHPDSDRELRWLLPDVPSPSERRRRARDHVAACLDRARRFHEALDLVPTTKSPTRHHLFLADSLETLSRSTLEVREGRLVPTFELNSGCTAYGDGTVTRKSALADERTLKDLTSPLIGPIVWDSVTFIPDDHLGITANPVFANNALFLLLEMPSERRPPEAGAENLP